jgi:CheY-like chemotaxis protein
LELNSRLPLNRKIKKITRSCLVGADAALCTAKLARRGRHQLTGSRIFKAGYGRDTEPMDKEKPRILVVEDEPIIAVMLDDMLEELGFAVVASVSHVAAALEVIGREQIDIALLDVNLGMEKIDPVADLLAERSCPFVFTTGYGKAGVPPAHADRTVVQKPFHFDNLAAALRLEIGRNSNHA